MALINNSLESLYGGVNQQSAEHRNSNQVQEMVNAYPTLDKGLLKRNPTKALPLVNSSASYVDINYTKDMWTYEYDRGLAGSASEQYSIQITIDGIEIINLDTGRVYKKGDGLTYEGESYSYIFPFIGQNGYAATTVKDTTFIVNKNIIPRMDTFQIDPDEPTIDQELHYVAQYFHKKPDRAFNSGAIELTARQYMWAPSNVYAYVFWLIWPGSTTTVVVDGIIIDNIDVPLMGTYYNGAVANEFNGSDTSLDQWRAVVLDEVSAALNVEHGNLYTVEFGNEPDGSNPTDFPPLVITRTDGTAGKPIVSMDVVMKPPPAMYGAPSSLVLASQSSDYMAARVSGSYTGQVSNKISEYGKYGFYWIKKTDTQYGYSFTFTVSDTLGNSMTDTIAATDGKNSETIAEKITEKINAYRNAGAEQPFSCPTSRGSIVKVQSILPDALIADITIGDSYGDQASFAWHTEVSTSVDLPKNLGFSQSIVKVIGTSGDKFSTYWLQFIDNVWKEWHDPFIDTKIHKESMPHAIKRVKNGFSVSVYNKWEERKIGDDDSNPLPSFVQTSENPSPKIKDIFFFKNRFGLITERTVVLSEVGEYGNFFRTSVSAVLDSDNIDATVDTSAAINLEYATYLENSMMLFSDKAQFRFEGGDVLSPKSVQVAQASAYEINKMVRPIFMNDRLFFVAKRGENSALFEYYVSDNSAAKSEANDITAHIQTYIDKDITKLSGSAVNNMLFLTSRIVDDTVYVYKYYDNGNERVQSAWFKWTFNGHIYSAFSFGKKLNILIARKANTAVTDWVLGNGTWDMSKTWIMADKWIMSPASISSVNNFEQMNIAPQPIDSEFIDDSKIEENLEDVLNMNIKSDTLAATSVLSRNSLTVYLTSEVEVVFDISIITGSVTLTVVTDDGSHYTATADVNNIPKITVPRKQGGFINEIYIDTIGTSVEATVNSISATYTDQEGDNLVYNGDFTISEHDSVNDKYVPVGWTYDAEWTEKYDVVNAGSLIPVLVNFGEWVPEINGKKEIRGHLLFRTTQISSEPGSEFGLIVRDTKRKTIRTIKAEYTIDRKPMVYGNSKNIEVGIASLNENGFRINTVSHEGTYNSRNKRS